MPQPTDAEVLARLDALAEDMLEFLAATVREPSESGWVDGDVPLTHSPDEHVVEADVVRTAKVIALTLTRLVVRGG
jgi:hypothetical protein